MRAVHRPPAGSNVLFISLCRGGERRRQSDSLSLSLPPSRKFMYALLIFAPPSCEFHVQCETSGALFLSVLLSFFLFYSSSFSNLYWITIVPRRAALVYSYKDRMAERALFQPAGGVLAFYRNCVARPRRYKDRINCARDRACFAHMMKNCEFTL